MRLASVMEIYKLDCCYHLVESSLSSILWQTIDCGIGVYASLSLWFAFRY